jgi:hypothetical protein
MKQVANNFCLHVMALDDKSYKFLKVYECESLTIDNLRDIETEELLHLKEERTRAEYCWTCGPVIILHLIDKYQLEDITYLDSDLMFYSSYEPIYQEIGNGSVAITPNIPTMTIKSGNSVYNSCTSRTMPMEEPVLFGGVTAA